MMNRLWNKRLSWRKRSAQDKAAGPDLAAGLPVICLCHDIERGYGHTESDAEFASKVAGTAPGFLEEMLRIEADAGIRATYHVVGKFWDEVADGIRHAGHTLGFHSFDHMTGSPRTPQLDRCRSLDAKVRGYRPPQSKLTPELTDQNLGRHGFEWLASAPDSIGTQVPKLENQIAKIPVCFDDYALYEARMAYADWERKLFDIIDTNQFVAFGLHDCYAEYWIAGYPELLAKLQARGRLMTLDQVADQLLTGNG